MTNRTSTGSTVPGIHPIPMASTSAPGGSQPRFDWTTAEPWFSTSSDSAHRAAKKPLPKTILARWTRRLRFEAMIFHPKAHNPARSRRGMGTFLSETPATDATKHLFSPLSPRNPLFPALRSAPTAVSRASRRKQIPSSQLFSLGVHPGLDVMHLDYVAKNLEEFFGLNF